MPFMVQIGPPQISIHQRQTVLISDPDGQIKWKGSLFPRYARRQHLDSRAEPLANTNDDYAGPTKPLTLAIDIGGSHLKAAVLNASGKISTGPLRVETPTPATPDAVVAALVSLS